MEAHFFQERNWGVKEVLVIGSVCRNYGLFYFWQNLVVSYSFYCI